MFGVSFNRKRFIYSDDPLRSADEFYRVIAYGLEKLNRYPHDNQKIASDIDGSRIIFVRLSKFGHPTITLRYDDLFYKVHFVKLESRH